MIRLGFDKKQYLKYKIPNYKNQIYLEWSVIGFLTSDLQILKRKSFLFLSYMKRARVVVPNITSLQFTSRKLRHATSIISLIFLQSCPQSILIRPNWAKKVRKLIIDFERRIKRRKIFEKGIYIFFLQRKRKTKKEKEENIWRSKNCCGTGGWADGSKHTSYLSRAPRAAPV